MCDAIQKLAAETRVTLLDAEKDRATLEVAGESFTWEAQSDSGLCAPDPPHHPPFHSTSTSTYWRGSWNVECEGKTEEEADTVSAPTVGQNVYCSAYCALAEDMVLTSETFGVEEAVKRGAAQLNKSANEEVFKIGIGSIELNIGFGWTVNLLFKGGKQHGELRAIKDALTVYNANGKNACGEFAKVEGFALFTKKVLVTPLRKQTLRKLIDSAKSKSKSAASGGRGGKGKSKPKGGKGKSKPKGGEGKSKPEAMGGAAALCSTWDDFYAFMEV